MDLSQLTQMNPDRPRRLRRPLRKFILDAFAQSCPAPIRLVQVGANDGKLADPVYPHIVAGNWTGMLIEPHPVYFEELQARHADRPALTLCNLAISDVPGTLELFHLNEAARSRYMGDVRGCASFERSRMVDALQRSSKRKNIPVEDGDVACTKVAVERLDTVLQQQGMTHADILVVDVEGHELTVLRSFDLGAMNPRLAIIECNGAGVGDEGDITEILRAAGLSVSRFGDDLIGIRPGAITIPLEAMLHFLRIDQVVP